MLEIRAVLASDEAMFGQEFGPDAAMRNPKLEGKAGERP